MCVEASWEGNVRASLVSLPLSPRSVRLAVFVGLVFGGLTSCDDGSGPSPDASGEPSTDASSEPPSDASTPPDGGSLPPGGSCREVRLTSYDAGRGGLCEYVDAFDVMPDFVRDNMTLAIAEPFAGGSEGGEFGEACGECWEISTVTATQIVMVTNLCPANEDNPVCQGPETHFDLSREAGEAVGHEGITIAQARPVPCPVTGNVHAVVRARNDFFIRLVFANLRFPIRTAEVRVDGTDAWQPLRRDRGAWALNDANAAIGPDAPGVSFRLTSPKGDVAEGSNVLPYSLAEGQTFDIGAQFDERSVEGGTCVYVPDGTVYSDTFGGSDPVLWESRAYGGAEVNETEDGCAEGERCLRVTNYARFAGAVFRNNDAVPRELYTSLNLMLRAPGGAGTVDIEVGQEGGEGGATCEAQEVVLDDSWTPVEIDLSTRCPGVPTLNRIVLINQTEPFEMLIDDVRFQTAR